jgi:hypothetical protein
MLSFYFNPIALSLFFLVMSIQIVHVNSPCPCQCHESCQLKNYYSLTKFTHEHDMSISTCEVCNAEDDRRGIRIIFFEA